MERNQFFSDLSAYLRSSKHSVSVGELSPRTNLFDVGLLESLDLPALLNHIEQKLGREPDLSNLTAESFFTMEAIFETIIAPMSVGAGHKSSIADGVREVLSEILGQDVTPSDDVKVLSELGASSASIEHALRRVARRSRLTLSSTWLTPQTTVAEMIAFVTTSQSANADSATPDVVMLSEPSGLALPRLFLFHPVGGSVLGYCTLAAALKGVAHVYGVQSPHLRSEKTAPASFEGLAVFLAEQVIQTRGDHPVWLGGWSFGAALASAVRRELDSRYVADRVFMLDPWVAGAGAKLPGRAELQRRFRATGGFDTSFDAFATNSSALMGYIPHDVHGAAVIFEADSASDAQTLGFVRLHESPAWRDVISIAHIERVAGGHDAVVRRPVVDQITPIITQAMNRGAAT